MKGKTKGSSTFYFAYKEGILVKDMTEVFVEGEAVARGMTIPITTVRKMETVLIK
ncbi:MAG: hypothetical protein KAW12_26595 [Candidatus Aminicenantes bacterium]|nr:hypothetical protein [Candidatus Aminicenantes bacterium]